MLSLRVKGKEKGNLQKKVFKRHTTWIYDSLTFFFFLTVQSGFHWIAEIKSLSGDPAV